MRYLSLPPGHLTTAQAAEAAGVTPAVIRYWVRIGRLTRCGGSPRYPTFRVLDVDAARKAAAAAKAA
ncbi:MerR family DNA-binding transcriptional regulator [Kitasatospora sp. NPDC059571]|uniref:MerR family DNA-binding transcriptional regulator n=1 Tax=Kitasatospora sp. NPDC059571 TaxID=3346871 RepID=UPI00367DABD4